MKESTNTFLMTVILTRSHMMLEIINTNMDLLESNGFKCSVSSVLNKDVKQHGKQFMFDAEDDTSWSSDQGVPQWISIQFEKPQALSGFSFQFQGGFVGKDATILLDDQDGNQLYKQPFYPDDINSVQDFKLETPFTQKKVAKVKFFFPSSTDFFGRIILYKLRLFE